jgi:hypothetical protein
MTISTSDESRCKATRLMRFAYLWFEISIDKRYWNRFVLSAYLCRARQAQL